MMSKLLGGIGEQRRAIDHVHRWIWILARARSFERIAAFLDCSFEVAGLAGDAAEIFELVVVGLELVVGDAPILNGHVGGERSRAIALDVVALGNEIRREKAKGHSVPVNAGTADARAGQDRKSVV